jgi:competence protein ComFC
LCGRLLEKTGERLVCRSCLEQLLPERSGCCPSCGLFIPAAGKPNLCASCLQAPPPFSCHRSAGRYQGVLKDLIILFKYKQCEGLGRPLAQYLWEALAAETKLWEGLEAVIPVPLHRRRLKERGFNQAAVLAHLLGKRAGVPAVEGRLVRVKNIPPQTGLDGGARKANVAGAFGLRRAQDMVGRKILLVDDVYTTGSTIDECCRLLKRAGAGDIRVLTLARAQA